MSDSRKSQLGDMFEIDLDLMAALNGQSGMGEDIMSLLKEAFGLSADPAPKITLQWNEESRLCSRYFPQYAEEGRRCGGHPEFDELNLDELKAEFDRRAAEEQTEKFNALKEWEKRNEERKARSLKADEIAKLVPMVLGRLEGDSLKFVVAMVTDALSEAAKEVIHSDEVMEMLVEAIAESDLKLEFAEAVADVMEARAAVRLARRADQRFFRWVRNVISYCHGFLSSTRKLDEQVARYFYYKEIRAPQVDDDDIMDAANELRKNESYVNGWASRHWWTVREDFAEVYDILYGLWKKYDEVKEMQRLAEIERYQTLLNFAVGAAARYMMGVDSREDRGVIGRLTDEDRERILAEATVPHRETVLRTFLTADPQTAELPDHYHRVVRWIPEDEVVAMIRPWMYAGEVPASPEIQAVLDAMETIRRVLAGAGTSDDFALLETLEEEEVMYVIWRDAPIELVYDAVMAQMEVEEASPLMNLIYQAIPAQHLGFFFDKCLTYRGEDPAQVSAEAPAADETAPEA